jgi:putative addiction module component (TIGR02574 family)
MSTATPTTDVDTLFEQSMKLSPDERLDLSERLLLSVPPPSQSRMSEADLSSEIARRIREHEADPSTAISLEEAIEEARRIANETS